MAPAFPGRQDGRHPIATGRFFFGESDLTDGSLHTAKDYRIDAPAQAAIRARIAKLDGNGPNGRYLQGTRTGFVLKTANNWTGPIGRFPGQARAAERAQPVLGRRAQEDRPCDVRSTRDGFAPKRDIEWPVLR